MRSCKLPVHYRTEARVQASGCPQTIHVEIGNSAPPRIAGQGKTPDEDQAAWLRRATARVNSSRALAAGTGRLNKYP
jgi:hypothetical protein